MPSGSPPAGRRLMTAEGGGIGFRPPSRIRAASASVSALGVASNSVARRRPSLS